MSRPHLWQGLWIDDAELSDRITTLGDCAARTLSEPLPTGTLLEACQLLSVRLTESSSAERAALLAALTENPAGTAEENGMLLDEVAAFLKRASLETKLRRELGSTDPLNPARIDFRKEVFEAWAPLGLLVHVAPTNAAAAGPLSVIEGLLSGNFNFLKTGGGDTHFAQVFFEQLGRCDLSGSVQRYVIVARIPSREQALLRRVFAPADGIAVWGGTAAVDSVRAMAPASARLVEWGHRISFAYVTASTRRTPEFFDTLARELCTFDQQACSSPQDLYLETESFDELSAFARELAGALTRISPRIPAMSPGPAERAEITMTTAVCRAECALRDLEVIEDAGRAWRLYVDSDPSLKASPLFRTLWIKPIRRERVAAVLRPFRAVLQTAGVSCARDEVAALYRVLSAAGVQRLRPLGSMTGSYTGEPHDGVYALQRYSRRMSVELPGSLAGISRFSELESDPCLPPTGLPVMTKQTFQAQELNPRYADLFFKSGGSSGAAKLSVFSYDDYHQQMRGAGEGLFAAGLDPRTDRCMNLFFGGALYGGFVSFFSVLESIGAVQFPMGAHTDLPLVARTIAEHRVNTLLGMPSYLIQLFFGDPESSRLLREFKGVRKIFYGGEHFNEAQKLRFREEFGVELIRSAAYGSVDAGPLGYQCPESTGSIHHLYTHLQTLEILELEHDQPVPPGDVGRLVFTSRCRTGMNVRRYEIGDIGRWIQGPCACGRAAPRFELLGRFGDVFRAGTAFLNYSRFARILAERLEFQGELQIEVRNRDGVDQVMLITADPIDTSQAERALLEEYADLREIVVQDRVLQLAFAHAELQSLRRTQGSGKLIRVVDCRRGVSS